MKTSKKAQYWYFDIVIGLSIFVLMLAISFKFLSREYLINTESGRVVEAERMSEALLSSGIPSNWTQEDVVIIGIESEPQKIDILKLERFANMSFEDYDNTRYLFGIKGNYLVFFENLSNSVINITNRTYLGKEDYTDSADLVSIKRHLVYTHDGKSEVIAMNLYVWS